MTTCPCCKKGIPSGERKSPGGLLRAYCTVCRALFWRIDGKWRLVGQPLQQAVKEIAMS